MMDTRNLVTERAADNAREWYVLEDLGYLCMHNGALAFVIGPDVTSSGVVKFEREKDAVTFAREFVEEYAARLRSRRTPQIEVIRCRRTLETSTVACMEPKR